MVEVIERRRESVKLHYRSGMTRGIGRDMVELAKAI